MKQIIVYSKNNCTACLILKTKMKALGMVFLEVNISDDEEQRSWLMSQGHKSVPQVYVDGVHTGNDIPNI